MLVLMPHPEGQWLKRGGDRLLACTIRTLADRWTGIPQRAKRDSHKQQASGAVMRLYGLDPHVQRHIDALKGVDWGRRLPRMTVGLPAEEGHSPRVLDWNIDPSS